MPAGAQEAEPAITITPSTDLVDGQVVQVTGSGFRAELPVWMAMCPGVNTCEAIPAPFVTAAADGSFANSVAVRRFVNSSTSPGGQYVADCVRERCTLAALQIFGRGDAAGASGEVEFATPELAIDIVDVGTLDLDTNDATVRAFVSCDVATPVSVAGTISQPQVQGGFSFDDVECSPAEPVQAFIPALRPGSAHRRVRVG